MCMDVSTLGPSCVHAVWNRVLNGLWKMNSSLPVERSAMIQNAQGAYLGVHPVPDLDFPWEKGQLPGDFRSSAWAAVRDPVSNGEMFFWAVLS